MTMSSSSKGLIVVVAAAMAVASLVLSIVTWARVTGSIASVGRTRDLQVRWEQLLSAMKDAESSQRGFQITGDEDYLRPFLLAERDMPSVFIELTRLHILEDASLTEVAGVRRTVDKRLDELREAILVRRREGWEPGREFVRAGQGEAIMDRLRAQVGAVTTRLVASVSTRTQRMQDDLKWGYVSAIGSGTVALAAGLVALILFRDTSRQLRREAQLAVAKNKAEEADRQKSSFLATMSHEIRTPMNAILGFGELLEGEAKSDKDKRYVQAILVSGRSLLQLINDILDLSKIEAGMMEVRPEPTDLAEVVEFIQQLFAGQAARKGVDLRVEIAPELPGSLLLDSGRLRQILLNLIGNSLKFTDKGHILLRLGGAQLPGGRSYWRLVIEVEDTGAGIAEGSVGDIFKPFVQAGGRPAAEHKGTGLGLAIVKRLTELMGGAISVRSEMGRGSTFRLDFPEVEVSARLPHGAIEDEPAVDFNMLRPSTLLVVDDNALNRELVVGIFESTHHRVCLASGGGEAVEAVHADKPDLVLMDIRMPGMDGREALALMRRTPGLELLPVIAVTASALSLEEEGLRRSFDGYVRKPFSRAELYREVAQFIPRVAHASEAGGPPPVGLEDAAPDAETRAGWRVLVARLRELEAHVWPGVREGMALSEIHDFAARLCLAGEEASCGPLIGYAGRLHSEAEAFAIEALERSLSGFPPLIAELAAASDPSS